LAGELEGHYIISIHRGLGVDCKLADLCNTASVGPRQYVLVRGLSEVCCRRSEACGGAASISQPAESPTQMSLNKGRGALRRDAALKSSEAST